MSKLAVINSAMRKIGAPKMVSLTENNPTLHACLEVYEIMRDDVLSRFAWGFATKYTTLAEETTKPSWGYTKSFALPVDCVRIMAVQDNDSIGAYPTEYSKVGNSVYTNAAFAYLVYISNAAPEIDWPQYFAECVAYKIAGEVALRSSMIPRLTESLIAMFDREFVRAQYTESLNSNHAKKTDEESMFLAARSSG